MTKDATTADGAHQLFPVRDEDSEQLSIIVLLPSELLAQLVDVLLAEVGRVHVL